MTAALSVLFLIGAVSIVVGVAMLSIPAALIVGGAGACAVSLRLERR